jgi:hypothetical protein
MALFPAAKENTWLKEEVREYDDENVAQLAF